MIAKAFHQRRRRPEFSRSLSKVLKEAEPEDDRMAAPTLTDALIEDAVRENASDVHLVPVNGTYQIRFRIDGSLVDTVSVGSEQGRILLRAIKSHAELDPMVNVTPQDARAEFDVEDRTYTVRVATVPGIAGESASLRFLPNQLSQFNLDELGLSRADHEQVTRALRDARGMILVCGPTSSGKTTTAYALLRELTPTDREIVTIEDPVEYVMEGVTQIQVNVKAGLTYFEGVKGLLKLDPDVIFMGEMRDGASARAAIDASDSGHSFISTLHARDAAGSITTLRNFRLTDHEIAGSLDLLIAQRLVRRLCTECRRQEPPTAVEREWLIFYCLPVPDLVWHAVGCEQCNQTGYRGRIGIFEVWRLNEQSVQAILKHSDERELRREIRGVGTLSFLEDDLEKVVQGVTTIEEMREIGGLDFFLPGMKK